MPERFPLCPFLPTPREGLDWRALHLFREGERGEEFYLACLEYGQELWRKEFAARAILCLDRAMGADLRGDESVLQRWPMPYAGMVWFLRYAPADVFVGNPRVHFQHYAGRMNEPRREQRRWRAWACWALSRVVLPDLRGDPKHVIEEPSVAQIERELRLHGHTGEAELWLGVLQEAGAVSLKTR